MTPVAYIAVGFCLPFALTAALILGLTARHAWERHRDARHPLVVPVWVRVAHIRDDSRGDFAAWEQELESEVDR